MSPPEGFLPLRPLDKVMEAIGPLYHRHDGDKMRMGFRVDEHHCNRRNLCHGGIIATFVDLLLGFNVTSFAKRGGVTVSLSVDYIYPASIGEWVEGSADVLRATTTLGFVQCLGTADHKLAFRASATFRLDRL